MIAKNLHNPQRDPQKKNTHTKLTSISFIKIETEHSKSRRKTFMY